MSPLEPEQNNPSYNTALGASEPTEHAKGLSEQSERWMRAAMQNSSDFVMILEADTTIRYINPAVERVLGYRPEDIVGTSALDYVHPEDLEHMSKSFAEVVKNPGIQRPIEYRVRTAGGSWRHMEAIRSNWLEDPDVAGLVANVRDVTERKEAEEALKKSEERFRALTQNSSDIITLLGADGTIRYQSPSVERILGYWPEEMLGENAFGYVHPEDLGQVQDKFAEGLADPDLRPSAEYRFRHKDGSWCYLESVGSNLLGDPTVGEFVVNSREVTERKRAEEALRESEERFRSTFEDAAIGMCVNALDGHFLQVNRSMCEMFGYSEEQLIATTFLTIAHPDDLGESLDRMGRMLEGEVDSFQAERRCLHADGHVVWVSLNTSVVRDQEGQPLYFIAQLQDITERRWAEEALKQSEERFRTAFEDAPVGVALVGLDGRRFRGNRALCEMLRCPEEDLLGENYLEHVHPDDRQISTEHFQRALEEGAGSYELERRYLRADGHVVWHLTSVSLIRDSKGDPSHFICLHQDITERKRAEEKIRQLNAELENRVAKRTEELAERERRLQELVGKFLGAQEEERRRVAYEVHDGLAQVAVAAHQHLQAFARRHPPETDRSRRDLERVLRLVRQTVSDARKIIAHLRPTALDDFGLAAAVSLEVERLREEGYQVDYEQGLGEERLPTTVEIALFRVAQEALTNVRKHADTRRVRLVLRRRGEEVYLEVRDFGQGFDLSAEVGGGEPGERVGLAGMRERVGMLGGELEIHGEPGAGTSVRAEIPLPATAKEN